MPRDIEILKVIVSEFPGLNRKISALYQESSSFLEICEDYVLCLRSINNLAAKNYPGDEEELNELKEAMKELREELLGRIR